MRGNVPVRWYETIDWGIVLAMLALGSVAIPILAIFSFLAIDLAVQSWHALVRDWNHP